MTLACLQSARCGTRQDVITAAARDLLTEHATLKVPYPSGMMSFAFSVTEAENGRPDFWHSTGARFIIPAGLITYGAVAQFSPLLQEVNSDINDGFLRIFPKRTHVDDYLQYAPIAGYFALYGVHCQYDEVHHPRAAPRRFGMEFVPIWTHSYRIYRCTPAFPRVQMRVAVDWHSGLYRCHRHRNHAHDEPPPLVQRCHHRCRHRYSKCRNSLSAPAGFQQMDIRLQGNAAEFRTLYNTHSEWRILRRRNSLRILTSPQQKTAGAH